VSKRAVVIGAGAMGAGAARALADRGWAVIVIEQFDAPNTLGGSGHHSRSFRLSHGSREEVRLAVRSLELWTEIERRAGRQLLIRHGILQRGSVVTPHANALAAENVPFDELDVEDVRRIFPELRPKPDERAIFQRDGAVILARDSITTQLELAGAAGGALHANEKATAVMPIGDGVRVFTRRRRIDADICVICAGPWSLPLLTPLGIDVPLRAGLAQVTFFRSRLEGWELRPGLMERTGGTGVYGMPEPGRGFKLGLATLNPDTFWKSSKVRPHDRESERELVERVREDFPGFDPTPVASEAGPFTTTPDETFVFGRRGPVVVGAGCAGHAFKFSPVIGELLADLADGRGLHPDAAGYDMDRPALAVPKLRGRVSIGV
jgi:sarcosine oxidase